MSIVENLNGQYLPPNDWKQVSRACLSGGDYLLWKSEFGEHCGIFEDRNRWNGLQVSFEMFMGEGAYRATNQQLNYPPEAYPKINEAALIACKRLPTPNKKSEDLSKIKQGPDEPYQDFVARLLDSVS